MSKAKIYVITGAPNSGQVEYGKDLALRELPSANCILTDKNYELDSALLKKEFVPLNIATKVEGNKAVLIISITSWLANVYKENNQDYSKTLNFCKSEWTKIQGMKVKIFVTTNELSSWTPTMKEEERRFTELHGALNKYIGEKADRVTVLISGKAMAVMN